MDPTLEAIPLLTMDESGKVPQSRLSKASSARAIFVQARTDDEPAAYNRGLQQLLLDGDPPYNPAELIEAGQPDTTNIDFRGAPQQLERAMAPYYKVVQSPEEIVSVSTLFGPEEERPDLNTILAEEITRTIRDSEQFSYQTTRLIHKRVWDGVGVLHWPDELDWRYRGSGLGQFYFPRQAASCEAELEWACAMEEYTVTRLYQAIKNPETAKANGWNVPAVENAIRKATAEIPAYQDWERLVDELKNNDLGVAAQGTPVIRIINIWVKEFNGTVSHHLTTEEAQGTEDFLYCARGKYKAMREAFVLFVNGIGSNTKIHSARGLGYDIFPFEHQRNRSLCRLIDQGNLASALMLQAPDEESLTNTGLQYFGNTAVIDPNCKVVQYSAPDLTRSVMPVLQEMERLRNDRVAGYSSDNVFDGDQRKTKFEVSAHLEQSATLSDSALDQFNSPYERALQQTIRRMTRRTYVPQDPGGREIADLHLRLVKRGVPLEALFLIDVMATKFVRAIGAGSASAKTLALTRIGELRPRMDDVGQSNLDRALAVDAVGSAQADNFFPRDRKKRTTVDTGLAILENFALLEGNEVPVLSSNKHLAHAREHIKPLLDGFTAVQEGQLPIEEAAVRMRLLYQHNAEHVDQVSGDPSAMEEAGELRQMMQQIGEVISNGLKKAEAAAAEAPAGEGEEAQGAPDAKQIMELDRHRERMAMDREKFDQNQQMLLEAAATKRAIADAEAAARIARTPPPKPAAPKKAAK